MHAITRKLMNIGTPEDLLLTTSVARMRIRKHFMPRTTADMVSFLLLFIFIPITFVFELAIVLPEFHESGGFINTCTWVAAVFVVFNITGNMIACMLVDTSIQGELLQPPTDIRLRRLWRYCVDCETMAPPRSWHCNTCDTCILKRDHHCVFTGCCVGHKNQRYFLLFMTYLFIGSGYTCIYTSIYIWGLYAERYVNVGTYLKLMFPMMMFALDSTLHNLYLLIYVLNLVAFFYTLVLMIYHMPVVLRGSVLHERRSRKYDHGWRNNLQVVLGRRMHLVWLSPFVRSELTHDGIHWESLLLESAKNL